jgi:hypothetical protein
MKVLLICVGDIHWKKNTVLDPRIFSTIGSSVQNAFVESPDIILVPFLGDIVYSGQPAEYSDVEHHIQAVIEGVASCFMGDIPIFSFAVPGNHDCDFSIDQTARKELLDGIAKKPPKVLKGQLVDVMLSVQESFFEFNNKVFKNEKTPSEEIWSSVDPRIAWKFSIDVDGKMVSINCLNSSWTSQIYDKPGALYLPEEFPKEKEESELEITVFHHPLAWLSVENRNKVNQRLLEGSDVIITGHEHASQFQRLEDLYKGNLEIFCNGAIWDDKSKTTEFNAILINTEANKKFPLTFSWLDNKYQATRSGVAIDAGADLLPFDFNINKYRRNRKLEFTEAFSQFLDTSDIELTHRKKLNVRLCDFFVFPDLKEIDETKSKSLGFVDGDKFYEGIIDKPFSFITGASGSGKTAVAKQLTRKLKNNAHLPLYVSAECFPRDSENVVSFIDALIREQYGPHSCELYKNSPNQDKVLVVDDYQLAPKESMDSPDTLNKLSGYFANLILFASDAAIGPLELGKFLASGDNATQAYQIMPLSIGLRDDLIKSWLSIDEELAKDEERLVRVQGELNSLIDVIVGQNFLSPYPPYVLAVLQGAEMGMDLDLESSTHGHLYEIFIKTILARRQNITKQGVFVSFVSYLAYRCLKDDKGEFCYDYICEVHSNWEEKTDLSRAVDVLLQELVTLNFLARLEESYSFREKFILYYFSANHIKDTLNEEETSLFIQEMTTKLWVEDYANTMLFLAHLSKDKRIVESMIFVAKEQFKDIAPTRLEDDVASIVDDFSFPDLSIDQGSSAEERAEALHEVRAEVTMPQPVLDSNNRAIHKEDVSLLGQLNSAVKTVQILGQMLKNFPANYSPEEKVTMVEECISLGMRILATWYTAVDEDKDELISEFAGMISLRRPQLDSKYAENKARKLLFSLVNLGTFSVIKRVSHSIGSNELERTYRKVFLEERPTSHQLVEVSLLLDHVNHFPERKVISYGTKWERKNPFAHCLLRMLIMRHCKIFYVSAQLRQRLSDKLNMKGTVQTLGSTQKIVQKR